MAPSSFVAVVFRMCSPAGGWSGRPRVVVSPSLCWTQRAFPASSGCWPFLLSHVAPPSSPFRTIPHRMWSHFWKVSTQGFLMAIFWPVIPQFVCNCLFYWALYFNPIINIDLVVKELRRLETQVL